MDSLNKFCDLWLAAWTGNRPNILLSFYHENIVYKDPGVPEPIEGREKLKIYFQKLLAKYPDWVWKRTELFPIKDGFTLIWKLKDLEGMDLVILKDDKIIRNEVYFDLSNFKKTLQNPGQTN